MTDTDGNQLVKVRSILLAKIGFALAVIGLVGLAALAIWQWDTSGNQREDRVVIERFKRSPCTGLTTAECRRKLITRAYLDRLLPDGRRAAHGRAGHRAPSARPAQPGRRRAGAPNSPTAPGGARPPSSGHGGSTPIAPAPSSPSPSPPSAPPAPAQPRPPLIPPLPSLPQLPDVCVETPLAGACTR